MRKRCHRRVTIPLPPRGLRPMLQADQLTDLAIAHLQTLDEIAKGRATELTLWDMVGAVFTWSHVADRLDLGIDEMRAQLELATRLVERYGGDIRAGNRPAGEGAGAVMRVLLLSESEAAVATWSATAAA